MSERDGRIPLTILGGYLGSGKSTWLRHMLHVGEFRQAHVLVNEAAAFPVDHLLLAGAAGRTVLAAGCACCEGKDRFVAAMRDLCDRNVASIVLETSGLSDPAQIAAHISTDGVLARRIRIVETIVLADGLHAEVQLKKEPLWIRQIEAADRIVLTKVDAATEFHLARLASTMAMLNPGATVSGAALGTAVDLPDRGDAVPFEILPFDSEAGPIRTLRLDLGATADWAAISTWLSAVLQTHGDSLVRIKGVVRAPVGRLLLQSVRGSVQPPEILPEVGDGEDDANVIVFIGRNFEERQLRTSFSRLTN